MVSRKVNKTVGEEGFTLIELMIVICIIACIIACSMGFYYWQLQRAKNVEAESTLLGIRNGCESCWYMSDKYDECSIEQDMMTGKNKVMCRDNDSGDEQVSYIMTSSNVYTELNPNPLMRGDDYIIRTYNLQGSSTYCYSTAQGIGDLTEIDGKDAMCP